MTEEKGRYDVQLKPGVIRESCFLPFNQGWTQPTPDEVKAMINRLGMSREEVSDYVGAGSGRSVRRWEAPEDSPGHRNIPYAAWRLLWMRLHPAVTFRIEDEMIMVLDGDGEVLQGIGTGHNAEITVAGSVECWHVEVSNTVRKVTLDR